MYRPNLPPLYEPVLLERVDSVVAEAERRAAAGADEGTLVWAGSQDQAELPGVGGWAGQPGDFNCALVLRPEFDLGQSLELLHVANVALLAGLAGLVSPGTDLRHRWPSQIFANDSLLAAATVRADCQHSGAVNWLVLGTAVHLEQCPDDAPEPVTSVREEQGELDFTSTTLLESFSRHFLSWVSRWSDEGFEPVARAWTSQAEDRHQELTFEFASERLQGVARGLDDSGNLALASAGEAQFTVTLMRYFGFEDANSPTEVGAR